MPWLSPVASGPKCSPLRSCPRKAAQAIGNIGLVIGAILGIYQGAIVEPDADGPSKAGRPYGVPMLLRDFGPGLRSGRAQGDARASPLPQSENISRISVYGVVARAVRDSAAANDYLTHIPKGGSFTPIGQLAAS
jgi:hypothetical protein